VISTTLLITPLRQGLDHLHPDHIRLHHDLIIHLRDALAKGTCGILLMFHIISRLMVMKIILSQS
jgi:hypothetical protein